MWKKLIIGKEPENTRLFCNCGQKYRSDSDWIYFERKTNPDADLLDPMQRMMLEGMCGKMQINQYKCPYCNVKEKLSDPMINYTKNQLIKFCKMTNTDIVNTDKIIDIKTKLLLELN